MHRTLVRTIMTAPAITVRPLDNVADAGDILDQYQIRRLPVVDEDGCLVGIITDSDILEAETAGSVLSTYQPGAEATWLTVEEIMETAVITASPDESLGQLVLKLMENKVGGLPVVVPMPTQPNRSQVIGVISETDVFQLIISAWHEEVERQMTDIQP